MSDIGILNDPLSLIAIALIFGSPGLLLGGIAGALLWRGHRIAGSLLGAIAGFVLWLGGWMVLRDVI
jgi:Na+/proline symporter